MRQPLFVKSVISYSIVFMVLLTGTFVNDAFGIGSCNGLCQHREYIGGEWICISCESSWCEQSCINDDRCGAQPRPCCLTCGGDPNKHCCAGAIRCCRNTVEGCCNSQCYNVATQKCCLDSANHYICDINEGCCNGQCYDVSTQKCCGDTGQGYICGINESCCNGQCCEYQKCCDNGVCKGPICDNCHDYDRTFDECFHWATDPCGTPCSTTLCIHNVLSTATCDYHSDTTCPSKCTAQVQATGTGCWQTVYRRACPGGVVDWHQFVTLYTDCPTCTGWDPGGDSCLTNVCNDGVQVGPPMEHGALWRCTGTCP